MKGNKIYGVKVGINYSVWMKNDLDTTIRGNYHVTNNIFYSRGGDSRAINYANQIQKEFKMGVLDSNLYISPTSNTIFSQMQNFGSYKVTTDYSLEAWQNQRDKDIHSRAILPKPGSRTWEMEDRSTILVNDTEKPKEFDLGKEVYYNIEEQKVSGKVTVAAYDAEILFKF